MSRLVGSHTSSEVQDDFTDVATAQDDHVPTRKADVGGVVVSGGGETAPRTKYTFEVLTIRVPFEKGTRVLSELFRIRLLRYLLIKFSNTLLRICEFGVLWVHTVGVRVKFSVLGLSANN